MSVFVILSSKQRPLFSRQRQEMALMVDSMVGVQSVRFGFSSVQSDLVFFCSNFRSTDYD